MLAARGAEWLKCSVRHGAIPQIALRETGEYPLVSMTLQDIEQEALGLSERDRAELALVLMRTLSPREAEVTDEEVFRRDEELETGAVEPMPHDEFVRRVQRERGR